MISESYDSPRSFLAARYYRKEIAMNRLCISRTVRWVIGSLVLVLIVGLGLTATAFAEGPTVVAGPGADAECFKPWGKDTKYYQFKKKSGPYRIALANGFIGNTWRIQMIKTAKAYVEQPA